MVETALCNKYKEKVEDAWTAFGAAQCAKQKDFEKGIIKPFEKLYRHTEQRSQAKEFIEVFKPHIRFEDG